MSGRDCDCHLDITLLVRSCCSQTGPPNYAAGKIGRRQRFVAEYRDSLASDYESAAGMSRRQEVSLYRAFEDSPPGRVAPGWKRRLYLTIYIAVIKYV